MVSYVLWLTLYISVVPQLYDESCVVAHRMTSLVAHCMTSPALWLTVCRVLRLTV